MLDLCLIFHVSFIASSADKSLYALGCLTMYSSSLLSLLEGWDYSGLGKWSLSVKQLLSKHVHLRSLLILPIAAKVKPGITFRLEGKQASQLNEFEVIIWLHLKNSKIYSSWNTTPHVELWFLYSYAYATIWADHMLTHTYSYTHTLFVSLSLFPSFPHTGILQIHKQIINLSVLV